MKTPKNAVLSSSILAADFANMGRDLKNLEDYGSDWVHVDIMDGHFVPNLTFGPDQMAMMRPYTSLPFDVHLMIDHPEEYVPRFIDAGADLISVHVETEDDLDKVYKMMEDAGIRKGIVISPDTPVSAVEPWLDRVDMVLVMSVHPGFGGQKFIEKTYDRVRELRDLIGERPVLIEVDGGVGPQNRDALLDAGVNVLVAGSSVFHGDMKDNIKKLKFGD